MGSSGKLVNRLVTPGPPFDPAWALSYRTAQQHGEVHRRGPSPRDQIARAVPRPTCATGATTAIYIHVYGTDVIRVGSSVRRFYN